MISRWTGRDFSASLSKNTEASNVLDSVYKRSLVSGHVRPHKKGENERKIEGGVREGKEAEKRKR